MNGTRCLGLTGLACALLASGCGLGVLDFLTGGLDPGEKCGNSKMEGDEVCDGTDLGGVSCQDLGFSDGALACSADCASYDQLDCGGSCTPDCSGRECGPDPICHRGCGTCSTGTCVSGVCRTDVNCPADSNCAGRVCGPDPVCGTSCGNCESPDVCSGSGDCVPAGSCGLVTPQIVGGFATSLGTITFDHVEVGVTHARDIDPAEDGCVVRVEMTFGRGDGCELQLVAGDVLTASGGLGISELSFQADSQCPNFPNEDEGYYSRAVGFRGEVRSSAMQVSGQNVAEACLGTTLTVNLEGPLSRSGGGELTVSNSQISVSGEFSSTGSTSISCPERAMCDGQTQTSCDWDQLVFCDGLEEAGRWNCTDLLGDGSIVAACGMAGGVGHCVMPEGAPCVLYTQDQQAIAFPCGTGSSISTNMGCIAVSIDEGLAFHCQPGHSSCSSVSSPTCQGDLLAVACNEFGSIRQLVAFDCVDPGIGDSCSANSCQGQQANGYCIPGTIECATGLTCDWGANPSLCLQN